MKHAILRPKVTVRHIHKLNTPTRISPRQSQHTATEKHPVLDLRSIERARVLTELDGCESLAGVPGAGDVELEVLGCPAVAVVSEFFDLADGAGVVDGFGVELVVVVVVEAGTEGHAPEIFVCSTLLDVHGVDFVFVDACG